MGVVRLRRQIIKNNLIIYSCNSLSDLNESNVLNNIACSQNLIPNTVSFF